MLNLKMIGQRIIDMRKKQDMNQEELADALFVTRQAVSKWEMGKGLPSLELLVALTKLFDISIDYLLDSSDVDINDYQTMFMTYPRESVIYKFLHTDHPDKHIKDIFYLLTPKERQVMIDQILSHQVGIKILSLWPYASVKERKYILENVLSKGTDELLTSLYALLTNEERLMVGSNKGYHTYVYQKHVSKKEDKKR